MSTAPFEFWSGALLSCSVSEKTGVNEVAEQAFRRHYGHVYRYLRRRTGDHHRAEDLAQQVFADAVRSLRETESPSLAWLYTVAQRRFADEVRRDGAVGVSVRSRRWARGSASMGPTWRPRFGSRSSGCRTGSGRCSS